jgi:hypothetical protein
MVRHGVKRWRRSKAEVRDQIADQTACSFDLSLPHAIQPEVRHRRFDFLDVVKWITKDT